MLLLMYAPAPQPLDLLVAGGNSKHLPPLVKQLIVQHKTHAVSGTAS